MVSCRTLARDRHQTDPGITNDQISQWLRCSAHLWVSLIIDRFLPIRPHLIRSFQSSKLLHLALDRLRRQPGALKA